MQRYIYIFFTMFFGISTAISCNTNSGKAQQDDDRITVKMPDTTINPADSMVYWTIGDYQEPYYDFAETKITDKYGIIFKSMGSTVNDSIRYFVDVNNEKLFQRLQSTHKGFNENEMLWEMQDLVTLHKTLEGIAFSCDSIIKIQKIENEHNRELYIQWYSNNRSPEAYDVELYSSGIDGKATLLLNMIISLDGRVSIEMKDGYQQICNE